MLIRISSSALRGVIIFTLLLLSTSSAFAQESAARPFLHPLFTDHMVIQRDISVPVWGWAAPGRKVTVSMAGKSADAVTDAGGKWLAKIGPFRAGGPYTLTVSGPQSVTVSDVLVGDVWICSGQSNMQMEVAQARDADAEVAAANHPRIRLFKVPSRIAFTPQESIDARWQTCTPETVRSEQFSAVAYFFGRTLHRDLNVPIGLIESAWGGTIAEAWASAGALNKMSDFRKPVADLQHWAADPNRLTYAQQIAAWWRQDEADSPAELRRVDPAYDASAWKTVKTPQNWEEIGLAGFDGVVWFRKEIDLPEAWAGKAANLRLGTIDDMDTTWVNGTKVGETCQFNLQRDYQVPAGVLKAGRNVIAVRVLDTGWFGGIMGAPELSVQDSKITLAGDWQYQVSFPLAQLKPLPSTVYENNPNNVTVLYNGMIAPLVPFAIKGAIWYQGESNADRPLQYRTLLPTMISDWRSAFGVGDFPFLIVQLAGFTDPIPDPVQMGGWAELREAQLLTAAKTPKCGLAVAIDIGDAKDIHPKNKQDVGYRLALAAEAIAHGRKIEYSGPLYRKMKIEGKAVRLYFDHLGGGLLAKDGGKLRGFAIAGADKRFVWADAVIDGKTVVVSASSIDHPVAVRYDWANLPDGNLYNKAGLPASPFRTDVE